MIDKQTVFILGAGASCPYGYPSGVRLRERIIIPEELVFDYDSWQRASKCTPAYKTREISEFKDAFNRSHINSIDMFMANNPKLAPIGKYIITFEIFRAERQSFLGKAEKLEIEKRVSARNSKFGLSDQPLSLGDFWYSYLYNRLIEGQVGPCALSNFSDGKLVFITFNYDRSLEQFFYEALRNSFTEAQEDDIVESLKKLKILHIYGQIAPLKWQNTNDYVDYKPQIDESLLQSSANNLRTIYEEKENPELKEAHYLLTQSRQIFFLGFGYTNENLEVLGLPHVIPPTCLAYGTAFGLIKEEAERIENKINHGRAQTNLERPTRIESGLDCLMLLRKYLE